MENKIAITYLIIGSNLGDKKQNLCMAINAIEQYAGKVIQYSSLYDTEPWGIAEQPTFLNQVLKLETTLQPEPLLQKLLEIEENMGRIRAKKYGERIIDIDILFYNNQIHESSTLSIPHPRIAERQFVLIPLCEIAPQFIHPVLQKTIKMLLDECDDRLKVNKT